MLKRIRRFGISSHNLVVPAVVLAFAVMSVPQASADVIIIGSSMPGLKAGTVLGDGNTIDLPAGQRVRVMLPSGRTQAFNGPMQVKVSSLAGVGEAADQGLWNDVKRLATQQKKPIESSVGAARSVAPQKPRSHHKQERVVARNSAFSWRRVPVEAEGSVCIEKGAKLELRRGRAGRMQDVSVAEMESGKRAKAEFATGAVSVSWPDGLEAKAGAYFVGLSGAPIRQVTLVPLSRLPPTDDTLRVLHANGCRDQMKAWIISQGF